MDARKCHKKNKSLLKERERERERERELRKYGEKRESKESAEHWRKM